MIDFTEKDWFEKVDKTKFSIGDFNFNLFYDNAGNIGIIVLFEKEEMTRHILFYNHRYQEKDVDFGNILPIIRQCIGDKDYNSTSILDK